MVKITYTLLMLTTLPMTMSFNLLSEQSIAEYIEQLKSTENPNEVLSKIDSHSDRRKDLSKLGVTQDQIAAFVHRVYTSTTNPNAKKCLNDILNLDGSFKNLSTKENMDQYMDAIHSCSEQNDETKPETSETQD